ncbi:hypothetical protein OAG16_00805 [Saprospiraceae bacterium]|nr:hypothetical protein [Saprospiraceae bacterium]
MKDQKDISELIRNNLHKLEKRPSERTWERLESRLDNRRSHGNTFLYRQIAMAAAVVALVAVISLITVLFDKQESQFAKINESSSVKNWIIQDLETVYTDARTNISPTADFQKELKKRYANPIQEGPQAKKLLASNNTLTKSASKPERSAKELKVMKKNKRKIEVVAKTTEEKQLTETNSTFNTKENNKSNSNVSSAKKSNDTDLIKNWLTLTQQMEWIIGAWREDNSLVEWQKVNKSTILCDEFVLKEKRNIGLQLIDSKSQVFYNLVVEEKDKKVFSNKNSDRIILKNISTKKFTMTFIPAKGNEKIRTFVK